jgi:hypothetical protein
MLEIMRVNFGVRTATLDVYDESGEEDKQLVEFDFDAKDYSDLQLMVDIGASAYWSEIAQAQTADGMLVNGIFGDDPIMYLEALPDHVVKNKSKLISKLRAQQKMNMMLHQQAQTMGNNPNYIGDDGNGMLQTKTETVDRMDGEMI